MSRTDYSKWDHIEISDDEDDQHPNIDKASLNRWRHQARVERMEEAEKEKKAFEKQISDHKKKKEEIETKQKAGEDVTKLEQAWNAEDKKIKDKQEELRKKEKLIPWNVDTISQERFSKTVLNVKAKPKKEELTDEERAERFKEFRNKNKKLLDEFAMLGKYADSRRFLLDHPDLACEETTNYLTVRCIDLAMDDKMSLMEHVSHQTISMQFMLEFAKQVDRDPRSCISDFYSKIAHAEQLEYKQAFEDELEAFRERVKKRAQERIDEALAEIEEEERQKRIEQAPGKIDPQEVYDSLPDALKKCFDSQDVPLLQKTIAEMPIEQATYHMKRCVDSGLWVPEGGKKDKNSEADAAGADNGEEEPKYETVPESSSDKSKTDKAAASTS